MGFLCPLSVSLKVISSKEIKSLSSKERYLKEEEAAAAAAILTSTLLLLLLRGTFH